MNTDVLVVGAGIVGVCCASFLQDKGFRVTVVDSSPPGEGCSFGNAGNVSPGAVIPYAMPGTMWHVPRWLFSSTGPLSIRAAHLPQLAPWLFKWLKASRTKDARRVSEAMGALHKPTFKEYRALLRDADGGDLIRETGQLHVSADSATFERKSLVRSMYEDANVRFERLNEYEILELEPTLSSEFKHGLFFPDNGYCVNPYRLVQVIARYVAFRGGGFIRDSVKSFHKSADGPHTAVLTAGEQTFDLLVVAAGAWSATLASELGSKVPLEGERGYHVEFEQPDVLPGLPISNKDSNFVASPMETGLRLAGTAEFAGLDAKPNWSRADALIRHGSSMFPELNTANVRRWMGSRPSLPDGLPVLDRSEEFSNVFYAFGNGHFGLTGAPMMGKTISEMAADERTSLDIQPFRVNRFKR